MEWTRVAIGATLALAAVYIYTVAALFAHARLSRLAPPRSLAGALVAGAWMPACGCTALAHARRAAPGLRAPFLLSAYAASPLLVAAAWLLAGRWAALAVFALALLAGAAAAFLPKGEPTRTRLDDLLLRRGASPLRDALPYMATFGLPALGVGALIGAAGLAPAWARGLAFAALAAALAAPRRDVAEDHGAPFARRLFALHVAFAATGGVVVALLAQL